LDGYFWTGTATRYDRNVIAQNLALAIEPVIVITGACLFAIIMCNGWLATFEVIENIVVAKTQFPLRIVLDFRNQNWVRNNQVAHDQIVVAITATPDILPVSFGKSRPVIW
jgi:hypothetical protein